MALGNESSLSLLETEERAAPWLDVPDPEFRCLVMTVFQQCVLGKVFPPEAPLRHPWISPGGFYRGQWIWDTMFVADLLALLPDTQETLRGVFRNYWEFQTRWNAVAPPHAHDMVACMMHPGRDDWKSYPAYSQIPILAWGVERVFRRNRDAGLVQEALDPLERFHNWYWRERDVTDVGLVGVGAYSGDPQHARYETFDYECNLDDLELWTHPKRSAAENGPWYGNLCLPGMTAYLVLSEHSLARLADAVGAHDIAARARTRAERGAEAMRRHMWDEDAGTFLAVNHETLAKVRVPTIGSWIPLHAGIPTAAQAQRMATVLASPEWLTPLPVPTVGRRDPHWNDGKLNNPGGNFWRGDVWPATNYQIADGLARYGFRELAGEIASRTIRNALRHGLSEHYDCDTGAALGVTFLGMTATVLTMALDGLTQEFTVCIKPSAPATGAPQPDSTYGTSSDD